ncbi:MAG: hypothetical protein ACTHLA_11165 [Asticcacaulis sp.]|uniref:hypothetical protein n=1 Tax=Asticcacaulis sp. TaxID=1872648 RepID=UPI003F7B4271
MSDFSFTSRADFISLATAKFEDAKLLLKNNRYTNAYYLAGYSVEMGLKAAACKLFLKECLPNKKFVNSLYSHSISDLIGLSGLKLEFDEQKNNSPDFAANWAIVSNWDESSRYENIDEVSAVELINAISNENSGVMKWLMQHW